MSAARGSAKAEPGEICRNRLAPNGSDGKARAHVLDRHRRAQLVQCKFPDEIQFLRSDKAPDCMHPSRACQVALSAGKRRGKTEEQPKLIGWIGELHPAMRESLRFKQPAYLFEINLDAIRVKSKRSTFVEIPATPTVTRDLRWMCLRRWTMRAVQACIRDTAGKTLKNVALVSIYQPANGQKSLSFRLTFQSPEKTLTTEEVDGDLSKARAELASRLSATFRE